MRLRAKFPATLIEVTRVPDLGAKTARRLFDELDVSSLEDLRAAAEAQRIRELKGLGPKVEENILASLEQFADPESLVGRLLLSKVRPIAEELAESLRAHPAAIEVEVAGSVRRWAETCKDIDLIATAEEPEQLSPPPRRPPADRRRRHSRAPTASAPRPTTASRSTCGSSPPRPSATCCSTSPARRPTTSRFARTPSPGASRSPSTG